MSYLDLGALLADPSRAAQVPVEEIPPLLSQLAADRVRLVALEGALAGRLLAAASRSENGPKEDAELVDDVREVGRLIRRSVSWVRKHGHTLPGFHQPGGKKTKVAWARRALLAWANGAA